MTSHHVMPAQRNPMAENMAVDMAMVIMGFPPVRFLLCKAGKTFHAASHYSRMPCK
jgi:hypothetical protein